MEINLSRTNPVNHFELKKDKFQELVDDYLYNHQSNYTSVLTYNLGIDCDKFINAKSPSSIIGRLHSEIRWRQTNGENQCLVLVVINFKSKQELNANIEYIETLERLGPGTGFYSVINLEPAESIIKSSAFADEDEKLKPYLVERTDRLEYGEDKAMVLIAKDKEDAKRLAILKSEDFKENNIQVTEINLNERRVILVANTGA